MTQTITLPEPGYDARPGHEFQFDAKPTVMAAAVFVAITEEGATVTRRFSNIENLPDDTPVVANWHGQRRTDAFITTVGELKRKAV